MNKYDEGIEKKIQTEANDLRMLLSGSVRITQSLQTIYLDKKTPNYMRIFWETVGWSSLFASRICHPDRTMGQKIVKGYLKDCRESDNDFKLSLKNLPHQFRLVKMDDQGVGCLLTNEDNDSYDPAIFFISTDQGTISPVFPSYLRFAAHALIELCFAGWYSTRIETFPAFNNLQGSKNPFAYLSTATVKLSELVWAHSFEVTDNSPDTRIFHASFEALLYWLSDATDISSISIPCMSGKIFVIITSIIQIETILVNLHVLKNSESGQYFIGQLMGISVMIFMESTGFARLAVNIRHAELILAILVELRWIVS